MLSRFFLNCNDGIPPNKVSSIVSQYGQNVLIGVDPGMTDRPDQDAEASINAVREVGAKLHIYLVGPGMMTWSKAEADQIMYLAKSVNIDTKKANWHNEWINWGWKTKNIQQFEYYYKNYNAYSCEIDNIDSSYIGEDPDKLSYYYVELYNNLKSRGIKTKLMIKNLNEGQLKEIIKLFDAKVFGLDFLCEFGMFEAGTGNSKNQIDLCAKMGIQAVTPLNGLTDTNHYGTISSGVVYNVKR